MTRAGLSCIGAIVTLGSWAASGQSAGTSRPLATVSAVVEMSNGAPVVDLARDDFEVAIDGLVQRIETFSTDDAPVTFVLLVDLTWSVSSWLKPEILIDAMKNDVVPLLAPGDRLRFERVEIGPPVPPGFLSNPAEILKASRRAFEIDDEGSAGASPLWDRTIAVARGLAAEPGRRAIILVSDGQATGNRHSADDAILEALANGVTVHAMAEGEDQFLRQSANLAARIRPALAMQRIADLTGGVFARDLSFPRKPGPHLARVVRNVHRSYTIGFVPQIAEGAPRVLRVVVKRPGVRVLAPQRFTGR